MRYNKISGNHTKRLVFLLLMGIMWVGCDDFVEVEPPKQQLSSESIFEDATTVTAALRGIYAKVRTMLPGINREMGLYSDELDQGFNQLPFFNHTVLPSDNIGWWGQAYNNIYQANALIEGLEKTNEITLDDENQLMGEALFIRAYMHWCLVELFGPAPYIATTDYRTNTNVSRNPIGEVYGHIEEDLGRAISLLGDDVSESPEERIRPYGAVAEALLARVYLYTEQWALAESMASNVIDNFVLEPDLDQVFLKNASGTIWQLKPEFEGRNTSEGQSFIFNDNPPGVVLSNSILDAFEVGDLRRSNWVRRVDNGPDTWYHAFKYKEGAGTTQNQNGELESIEYSIVFRLAEQYLIRAEARVQLGNTGGAQADLNVIRNRAGLENTTASTVNNLLEAVFHERQVELFTEGGHRWFDLKRTGRAVEVLAPIKPNWRDTNILLPVPESEIMLNPNLLPQNEGY